MLLDLAWVFMLIFDISGTNIDNETPTIAYPRVKASLAVIENNFKAITAVMAASLIVGKITNKNDRYGLLSQVN